MIAYKLNHHHHHSPPDDQGDGDYYYHDFKDIRRLDLPLSLIFLFYLRASSICHLAQGHAINTQIVLMFFSGGFPID